MLQTEQNASLPLARAWMLPRKVALQVVKGVVGIPAESPPCKARSPLKETLGMLSRCPFPREWLYYGLGIYESHRKQNVSSPTESATKARHVIQAPCSSLPSLQRLWENFTWLARVAVGVGLRSYCRRGHCAAGRCGTFIPGVRAAWAS